MISEFSNSAATCLFSMPARPGTAPASRARERHVTISKAAHRRLLFQCIMTLIQRTANGTHDGVAIEKLGQEIDRTRFHCPNTQLHVALTRDGDDQSLTALRDDLLQVQPAAFFSSRGSSPDQLILESRLAVYRTNTLVLEALDSAVAPVPTAGGGWSMANAGVALRKWPGQSLPKICMPM